MLETDGNSYSSSEHDASERRGGVRRSRQRERAIDLLELEPGQRVVDVWCGSGENFTGLLARVASRGSIIGIESADDAAERARSRVDTHGWSNVEVQCASVARARWHPPADAALFAYTGALLRQSEPVLNVLRQMRPGGRVVALEELPRSSSESAVWRLLALYLGQFEIRRISRASWIATGIILASR